MDEDKNQEKEVEIGEEEQVDAHAKKNEMVLNILKKTRDNLTSLISLVENGGKIDAEHIKSITSALPADEPGQVIQPAMGSENVIEGVFNGEIMVGSDGKEYSVPENYSSKSKLVEGDILKLTIDSQGRFIFKQIGPIDRERIVGALIYDKEKDEYRVQNDERTWRVLSASISYFKAQDGDEVVVLVPKRGPSRWAAVENVIRK